MSPQDVAQRFDVSRESLAKLEIHAMLIAKWNRRINLVGPRTVGTMWERHFSDSLQLRNYLPTPCRRIIDLGSGAGFPGLVLAVVTDIDTVLVESNAKKVAFLNEAIRQTQAPARVLQGRIEKIAADLVADAVTARALAPLPVLLDLAYPLLVKGTVGLFLKGQDFEAELTESTKYWRMKVEVHASVTDPKGAVLVIREVQRV